MNIYFACSLTGGRQYAHIYRRLVRALLADGHEVPTAHLADRGVRKREALIEPRQVYARDVGWIEACDVLVAEVSVPSHGVGYEVGFALAHGKHVLCVYHQKRTVSKMISGNPHQRLTLAAYRDARAAVRLVLDFTAGLRQICE